QSALGISQKGNVPAGHRCRFRESEKHSSRVRRLYSGIVGRHYAFQRPAQKLEVAASAGGAEFDDLDFWHECRRSEYYFCRESLRLSLSQRLRRQLLDQAPTGAERDRRGLLAAELTSLAAAVSSSEF